MIKLLSQVNEFMKVMGQEMPTLPCIPSIKVQQLRYNLIEEENKELIDAVEDDNLVEIADALCDLLYVTLGAFTAYGFSEELVEELFDEVQRSNISKVSHTQEEAQATIDKLVSQDIENRLNENILVPDKFKNNEYVMFEIGGYWIVNRVSDNKTMKSINFSEPKLKPILRKYGVNI